MKVAAASKEMSSSFKNYYKDLFVIEDVNKIPEDLDLVIFTGGDDLNPQLYGENPNGARGWNDSRDRIEMAVFKKLYGRCKMLGVCRGMQFINVALGGGLYQDLENLGMSHDHIHKINYSDEKHPLSWLTQVNSLHHQALRDFGETSIYQPHVIATEPITGVIEIASWSSLALAVQFHPEMFNLDLGGRFFSIINDWVNEKQKSRSFFGNKASYDKTITPSSFITNTATTFNWTVTPYDEEDDPNV